MTPDQVESEVRIRLESAKMAVSQFHDYEHAIDEANSAIKILEMLKKEIRDEVPECRIGCSKRIIQINPSGGQPGPYLRTCALDCNCYWCKLQRVRTDLGELTHSG